MTNKIHALVLQFGYVEGLSNASLICYHPNGFDTLQEALESLAKALVDGIHEEPHLHKNCCIDAQKHGHKFCPTCGYTLQPSEKTAEYCEQLLYEFFHSNVNRTGGEAYDKIIKTGWMYGREALTCCTNLFIIGASVVITEWTGKILAQAYLKNINIKNALSYGEGNYNHACDLKGHTFVLEDKLIQLYK